jgi:hypothetical protein
VGHGRRRWRVIWAAGAVVLAVMVTAGVAAGDMHGGLPARMLSGHGMGGAVDFAENGGRVWATTYAAHGAGSVLELNASNGRWIRTFSGGRYGFRYPDAIAAGGGHIWVANDPQTGDGQTPKPGDGSVTELNAADGSWVRTLSGRRYGFDFPGPMTVTGADVWVVNGLGDSVTELNAATGALIRTVSGGRPGFSNPSAIAAAGGHLWIANQGSYDGGGWVTELNASDGSWVRTLWGPRYGFDDPSAIAAAGRHIWVANPYSSGDGGSGSVTELNASDGSWVQTLSGGCYNFDSPAAIAVAGNHVWVANSHIDQTGGSVTELNASDGSWVRTLSNSRWPRTLLHGCVFGILSAGSYRFINPSVIAAVGSHVWIPDGRASITVLTDP